MVWNHRVIEFVDQSGELSRQIVEVYYDEIGRPTSYSQDPAAVVWAPEEDPKKTLAMMALALQEPVLVPGDF